MRPRSSKKSACLWESLTIARPSGSHFFAFKIF
jgi:hypothetical protein